MTHLIPLSKEQLEQAEKDQFLLVNEKEKKFFERDLVIMQSSVEEIHTSIVNITRAVPGLLKNWIILSFVIKPAV